jgi:hypothetical protein
MKFPFLFLGFYTINIVARGNFYFLNIDEQY